VALVQGDEKRIGPLLLQALALQTAGRAEDLADFMLARAYAAEQRGDLALMLECNQAVLSLPVGNNLDLAASRCIALMNLYTSTLHAGDLETAQRHVLAAAEVASAFGFSPYRIFTCFLQAHLALTRGELEAANQHLRELPDYWPDVLDWHDLGCAHTILAHWHQAREDWKAADEAIRQSRMIFEQAEFQEGCKLPLERQLWQAVHRKQYARAASLFAQSGEQQRNIYDLALALPHARALHLAGQPQAAVAVLDTVLPALGGIGAQLHLTRGHLFEAAARLALGDRSAAERAHHQAHEAIERHGYQFLLEQDRELLRELGVLTAEKIVPAAEAAPAAGAGALEISVLGGFEVRLQGVLLDHWPRRKAKLVLAALLLYQRGLSVPEIAEIVGHADGRPEALTVYKVALSALRYTFEPELAKAAPSRYVLHEGERYRLAFERVASCDLVAFERAAAEGDRLRAEAPHEASAHYEQALALYRGPLFDDAFLSKYFDAEREKLRKRALACALRLAEFRAQLGDNTGAEQALTRAVAIAPCEEEAYVALMRLHKAQGRPERIRQVYWDYRKALKAALGLTPGEAFEASYAAIAAG
jgi:DNA-binding SARP family transcriptional activator